MAKEVIDRLAPKVHGMLRILHMPDVKDGEMRELIFRLGQTVSRSVFELILRSLRLQSFNNTMSKEWRSRSYFMSD